MGNDDDVKKRIDEAARQGLSAFRCPFPGPDRGEPLHGKWDAIAEVRGRLIAQIEKADKAAGLKIIKAADLLADAQETLHPSENS